MENDGSNPSAGKRIRVLCVDDNLLLLEALHRALVANPSLEWAGSLVSANNLVKTAMELCPDVVLLDLIMPGMNALDQMKKLGEECPNTRVLIFSADDSAATVKRASEAGAWGFISKDASFDMMVKAIEAVALGQKHFTPVSNL